MPSADGRTLGASLILFAMLVVAAVSDLRVRRVPNALNLLVLMTGASWTIWQLGMGPGLRFIAFGVLFMTVVWFPMFALRLMGAGDVKLLIACAAWLGWPHVMLASLVTGIAGGVLGVYWLVRRSGVISAVHALSVAVRTPMDLRLRPYESRERVPYAIAIVIGVVFAWIYAGRMGIPGGSA